MHASGGVRRSSSWEPSTGKNARRIATRAIREGDSRRLATKAWLYWEISSENLQKLSGHVGKLGALVPQLWRIEVANILLQGIRRKRHNLQFVSETLADLTQMRIVTDPASDRYAWNRTLEPAVQHRLTSYDACYLELALREHLPLVTLDEQLRIAAQKEGVALFW